MDVKFEVRTEMSRVKLVRINRTEFKIMRSILLALFGLGAALSIANLILQAFSGAISAQDIKNVIIALLGLAAAFFLPELVSFIQLPVYKQSHLDGMRRVIVTDDAIKIQPDKYAEKEYDFSLATEILDRGTYYKLLIGNGPLYLHKEDFVKGDPEYFFEYVKSRRKG